MKKLFFIFAILPFFAFGGKVRVKTFTTGTNTTVAARSFDYVDDLYSIYFNTPFAIFTSSGYGSLLSPSPSSNTSTWSTLLNDQISLFGGNSTTFTNSPADFASVNKIFVTASSLIASGYSGAGVLHHETFGSRNCFNIDFRLMVQDVLSSTNTLYHSILLSSLASINSSINNIRVDLGQFQTDYQSVNSGVLNVSNYIDAAAAQGIISDFQADLYKDDIASAYSDPATWGDPNLFARSVFDNIKALNDTINQASALNSNPDRLNDFARSFGNSFSAAGAGHFTTPLTNEMQRMSTDWVNETKAALSNNTQKIKDDLAAWKNQLHGTQTSIDNSAANIYNTLNNIAGGSAVVHVNVDNHDIGVTITDPVTIDPTQFNSFSEDLGKAGEYMESLYNEFKYWAWQSPDSWKTGFLDSFLHTLIPKVEQQVSLQHSISNLLADFAINFTNNTEFAISNALASFSPSSTNGYLLLSDYQNFIDSSKYNSVVSSLPDDLAAALSSFGFVDSSEYSGRWWVFQSANMALQSQLALTNAALSSTLLNALSAIDDSDDSGGSLLSRWLSLIDSIPDPEEIQQSLSDATNIVSNIGFERADALYSTATQDLVSVVKGIYRDKSLPDNIRFVFIPAAEGRAEKFVDIPVGEHSNLWSLFRSGMAFALSVVTLILFPKYVSWLVSHYTRLVERIIKSLHAYTNQ